MAFDAYGTLFEWDFERAVGDVLDAQGLEADHEAVAKTFRESFPRVSPWSAHVDAEGKTDRAYMLGGPVPDWISTREMWRRQFEIAFEEHKLTGDAEAGADHLRTVLSHAPAYPDAFDTVERLAAHGLRLGLLSNADEDFLQSAVSHNRLRFSVMQSSESLRTYKPNVAAFLALCARLGCAPGEVLYVGDAPPVDVWGALHAGLRSAWVRRAESEYPEDVPRPDIEVTALAAVADALGAP